MKRLILGSFVLGILIVAGTMGCSSQPIPVKPTPTAAPNTNGGVPAGGQIVATGRVTPAKSAALSFPIGGIVSQVAVTLGQHVESGTLLAHLDDSILQKQIVQAQSQLEIAQKQLAQAAAQAQVADKQLAQLKAGSSEADLASAQAAVAAANANYAQVKQGPSADELAQLKANVDNAKAALDQAQSAFDRAGGANNPSIGLTPQSLQLQQATNAYNAANAAYSNARSHPTAAEVAAAYAQVQQAQDSLARLSPTQAALDVSQAQADSAHAGVALAKTQVDAAQAAVDATKAQAVQYELVAPFAGTVTSLNINSGEYAMPGTMLIRFADISNWQIETTDLTELNIASVTTGTPVSMTFDAIPGLELSGKVTNIQPYGDTKQGDIVYTVIVTPGQQDPHLRWNMTAKVNLQPQQ